MCPLHPTLPYPTLPYPAQVGLPGMATAPGQLQGGCNRATTLCLHQSRKAGACCALTLCRWVCKLVDEGPYSKKLTALHRLRIAGHSSLQRQRHVQPTARGRGRALANTGCTPFLGRQALFVEKTGHTLVIKATLCLRTMACARHRSHVPRAWSRGGQADERSRDGAPSPCARRWCM